MKGKINWIVIISILIIVLVIVSMFVRYRVGKDERAVFYNRFSGEVDKENSIEPGIRYKLPWNEVHTYNITEDQVDEKFDVLDKQAISIQIEIMIRFFPIPDKIGYLDENFGKQYKNLMVTPEARSVVRQVCQRYSAEDIYSRKRDEVVQAINKEAGIVFQINNIQLKELLIRSVVLPIELQKTLEKKWLQESLTK